MVGWDDIPSAKEADPWDAIPNKSKMEGTISKGAPWWMRDIVKPTMEYGGLAIGGAIPAIAGLAAPPAAIAAVPMAGAGYAAGKRGYQELESVLYGSREPNVEVSAGQTIRDIGQGAAMEATGQAIGPIVAKASGIFTKDAERVIEKGIEKGIRPSVVGKSTFGQSKKYMERAKTAVKTIIDNKPNLSLTDETGNIITGELPKNLQQFSESINQVKRKIFAEYDAMAGNATSELNQGLSVLKQMGTAPASQISAQAQKVKSLAVDLHPIAKELKSIGANKPLQDLSPEIINYAEKRAEAFLNRGAYKASEAQDAISHLNQSLQAFYKNPTYENASKASVDAMIANRLRKGLDTAVENAAGPGYQILKNQYGALSAIEKDVTHRAIVDSRKNIKGLIDFSDIFSGSEVVHGILSMNPARVGAGISAKIISGIYKHLNNPNHIVKNMFSGAEKALSGTKQRVSKEVAKAGTTAITYGLNPNEATQEAE